MVQETLVKFTSSFEPNDRYNTLKSLLYKYNLI